MTEETKAGVPAAPKRSEFVPLNQVKNMGELFKHPEFAKRIAQAAPKHFSPDRLLRTFALSVQKVPKLAACSPMSMMGAFITLASLGLEPNTPLGHAYLIPFDTKKKNPETGRYDLVTTEVQVIIGYPGYIDLLYRGDTLLNLHCDVVWKGDKFSYSYGSNAHLLHEPSRHEHAPNEEPTHAYMYAKLKNGGEEFCVLTLADLHAVRARSQGYKTAMYAYDQAVKENKDPNRDKRYSEAPWIKDKVPMYKKTALRAGQKYLPKSVELAAAMGIDTQSDEEVMDFSKIVDADSLTEGAWEMPALTEEVTVPLDLGSRPEPEAERVPRGQEVKPRTTKVVDAKSPQETAKKAPEVAKKADPVDSAKSPDPTPLRDGHMDGPEKPIYPLFNAFGEENDGPSGPATDPVAFAKAFALEFADSDESGQEALTEYNNDAIQDAVAASEEAAKIISELLNDTHAVVESGDSSAVVKKTGPGPNFEELYYQPVVKNGKGIWDQVEWVKKAKATISTITDIEHLKGFRAVNNDTANTLSTTAKTVYHRYLDGHAQKICPLPNDEAISDEPPPPEEGDPGPGGEPETVWTGVARQLAQDFASAASIHELEALTKNVAVKAQLRQLKEQAPGLAIQLEGSYKNRVDELKGK